MRSFRFSITKAHTTKGCFVLSNCPLPNCQLINTTALRYTFNGKEDEIFSEWQDYGFRNYDKKQRRFTSVDPLTAKYPWNSPYSFAENDVIRCIDLDGLEKILSITWHNDSYAEVLVEVEDGNGYTHVENAVNQKMAHWGLSANWQAIRDDNPKNMPKRPTGMDMATYNDATGEFHQLYEQNGNLKPGDKLIVAVSGDFIKESGIMEMPYEKPLLMAMDDAFQNGVETSGFGVNFGVTAGGCTAVVESEWETSGSASTDYLKGETSFSPFEFGQALLTGDFKPKITASVYVFAKVSGFGAKSSLESSKPSLDLTGTRVEEQIGLSVVSSRYFAGPLLDFNNSNGQIKMGIQVGDPGTSVSGGLGIIKAQYGGQTKEDK